MSFLFKQEAENLRWDYPEELRTTKDPLLCEKQIPRFARDDNEKP